MRITPWTALVAVLSLQLLHPGFAPAQDGATETRAQAIERKRTEVKVVVRELASRDVSGSSEAQQIARRRNLARLDAWADARVFTENAGFPGRDVPFFVDDGGRRCAIANLIEKSGDAALLDELARYENHSYVSTLMDHEALLAWATENGFAPEEIAYIQGPGFTTPGGSTGIPQPGTQNGGFTGFTPGGATAVPGLGPDNAPRGGATGIGGRRPRRKKVDDSASKWTTWWALNRDAFLDVRARYHGATQSGDDARPLRPTRAQVDATVFPILSRIARSEPRLRATALMALARATSRDTAAEVVALILPWLRDRETPDREFLVLALGVTGDAAAVEPLTAIARDEKAGRLLVGGGSSIPDLYRGYAAVALGLLRGDGIAESLIAVLDEPSISPDVRAASVIGLGLQADAGGRGDVAVPYLLSHLEDETWETMVRAHVPLALARAGDRAALGALADYAKKFLGPTEVRRSATLALGLLGDGLEPELVEVLTAQALRDPDPGARGFAITALGELAWRDRDLGDDEPKERRERLDKLALFFADGLGGFHRQIADRPWYAIAAGLYAHAHDARSDAVFAALADLAREGKSQEERAAAAVGLGLVQRDAAAPVLRKLFQSVADQKVRGYAAEAMGIQRDRTIEAELLELVREADTDFLRYQAALGLAHLGSPTSAGALVDALRAAQSQAVRAGLTRAIGRLGDKSTLAPLVEIIMNPKSDRETRERAVAALAMIGEESDAAWSLAVRRSYNFTASTPTLETILGIF